MQGEKKKMTGNIPELEKTTLTADEEKAWQQIVEEMTPKSGEGNQRLLEDYREQVQGE